MRSSKNKCIYRREQRAGSWNSPILRDQKEEKPGKKTENEQQVEGKPDMCMLKGIMSKKSDQYCQLFCTDISEYVGWELNNIFSDVEVNLTRAILVQ